MNQCVALCTVTNTSMLPAGKMKKSSWARTGLQVKMKKHSTGAARPCHSHGWRLASRRAKGAAPELWAWLRPGTLHQARPGSGIPWGFLPQAPRLCPSKRESTEDILAPESSWRELKECFFPSFLPSKRGNEAILQKSNISWFFILQQETVCSAFPPALSVWVIPTEMSSHLFHFFPAVFLTLVTQR